MIKKAHFSVVAGFALALSLPHAGAAVVDINASQFGLNLGADGTPVNNLSNSGTAGVFSTIIGGPVVASHPANNNAGVQVQGVGFSGAKMKSANSMVVSGISGNQAFTVAAWVWNDNIGAEEAMISWGHRGGPDGSNMGLHQGTNGAFGAVGHWGGPDIGWGNGGADINGTVNRWAHLAYVYDGAGNQTVYIDGQVNNTDVTGIAALNPHQTFDDASATHIFLGSESDAGNENNTPIPFTGTIGAWYAETVALDANGVSALYNRDAPNFVDGVPEPSTAILGMLGLMSLFGLRRRR